MHKRYSMTWLVVGTTDHPLRPGLVLSTCWHTRADIAIKGLYITRTLITRNIVYQDMVIETTEITRQAIQQIQIGWIGNRGAGLTELPPQKVSFERRNRRSDYELPQNAPTKTMTQPYPDKRNRIEQRSNNSKGQGAHPRNTSRGSSRERHPSRERTHSRDRQIIAPQINHDEPSRKHGDTVINVRCYNCQEKCHYSSNCTS
jgi:hypothetical protein